MEKEYAEYLLDKTKRDYSLIAEEYARTRNFTWDIENLEQYAVSGEKVLDLGCGNGRLLEILKGKDINYFGLDGSEELIEIAKYNYPQAKFFAGNALNLPFPKDFFDKVFSVRVLHHIPSKEFQARFLGEVGRVLKSQGLLILTVWYLCGLSNKRNLLLTMRNVFLKIIGKSRLDFGDALIPWGKKVIRYYHYFTKKRLKKLAEESGFKVKKIWTTPFDIYLIAEKQ